MVNLRFVIYVVVSLSMLILTVLATQSNECVERYTHLVTVSERYKVSNLAVYADNVGYIRTYNIIDIQ